MENKTKMIYLVLGIFLVVSFILDGGIALAVKSINDPSLAYGAQWISNLGSVAVVLLVMTTLFLWEEKKKRWIPSLWASVIFTFLFVHLIKLIVQRPRPFGFVDIIPIIHWIDYSFPSGHAAVAFSAVPLLDKEFPKLRWFWVLFASLVALSRIYLNVHYASDVIAGIMIGYGFGLLLVYLEERHKIAGRLRLWRTG